MRLSEAIMLGSTTETLDSASWQTCLLGIGLHAIDPAAENFCNDDAIRRWPWIKSTVEIPCLGSFSGGGEATPSGIISVLAGDVQKGIVTLEKVVDWVRSVEPPDPSELLKEVDEAVGEHPEHQDVPMDMYERWERSAPERQG